MMIASSATPPPASPGSTPSAAAIGSIDVDAVVQAIRESQGVPEQGTTAPVPQVRQSELKRIMSEAQRRSPRCHPQTGAGERRLTGNTKTASTELKCDVTRPDASTGGCASLPSARPRRWRTLDKDIQQAVAAQAKAKGLTYVVKVSPGLRVPTRSPTRRPRP